MEDDLHPLETLRRLCGDEVACEFHNAFAGLNIRIPLTARPAHPISRAIGFVASQALSGECGGVMFAIPQLSRKDQVAVLARQGLSTREIAQRLQITDRHVYGLRKQLRLRRSDLTSIKRALDATAQTKDR